jgi:hypothetical protein
MGLMREDDRFHELLQRTIRELEPPPAPREEIWARVEAERAVRRSAGARAQPDVIPFRRRLGHATLAWSAALAATLVIGIGLGRMSRQQPSSDAGSVVTNAAPASDSLAAQPGDSVPTPYRLAATQHLQRTETLLTSLAVDAGATGVGEVSTWARELLTDTRLLLASPAAQDPELLRLLEDLELVLAQLSAIPTARAQQEVELIQNGINQSDVLLRLRAATAGPTLVGT